MKFKKGLEEDFFTSRHQHLLGGAKKNGTSMRSMYYPPLTDDSEIGTGVVRIRAHTDYETIILLFQDDVGGLEVICL